MSETIDDKTVSFRVFLSDEERTRFKVECAKDKTTMSQRARELIRQWLDEKARTVPVTTVGNAKVRGRGGKAKDKNPRSPS